MDCNVLSDKKEKPTTSLICLTTPVQSVKENVISTGEFLEKDLSTYQEPISRRKDKTSNTEKYEQADFLKLSYEDDDVKKAQVFLTLGNEFQQKYSYKTPFVIDEKLACLFIFDSNQNGENNSK